MLRRGIGVVLASGLLVAAFPWLGDAGPMRGIRKISTFSLQDIQGKKWSLEAQAGKQATVLVFVSTECPMSNSYLPQLVSLAQEYAPKGVAFAAINANPEEDLRVVTAHAKEFGLSFPLLLDPKQAAVKILGATTNPEVFVLDSKLELRYRGRIDDGYSARLVKNSKVTRYDLREALDEVLAGKPVSIPVTRPLGCAIEVPRQGAAEPQITAAPVTYHRDIAPILQQQCQGCHRPGEVGPFSLTNYRQAIKWGVDIKEYTQNRKMPPWKPTGDAGQFRDERGLSPREIDLISQWVDGGMPEGDPKNAPPPPHFPEGWQLGEPDLVLTVPEPMTIGATGKDLFRVFVLPTGLTEDKFVSAIEVRPGNKRVVHHTLNFLDTQGRARKLEEKEKQRPKSGEEADHGPGYSVNMGVGFFPPSGSLAGWAPGNVIRPLPDGVGYYLPKGADVVVQVHYHRTGKVEQDQLRLGLYFSKQPVRERLMPIVLAGMFLQIPAGAENHRVRGAIQTNQDITLYQITPHMHLLGRRIRATVTFPDGERRELIAINDWDYNWQETYYFKDPIKVPKGSKFEVEAFYDNSEKNPLNPNSPPRPVRLGEETTDEMCFVFLGATSDQPGRISVSPVRGDQ
jgi:peroxiredoxin/mono/diheme cytochrome c family protein